MRNLSKGNCYICGDVIGKRARIISTPPPFMTRKQLTIARSARRR